MCGITGFLVARSGFDSQSAIVAMTDAIIHRGPDAGGHWCDQESGASLGMRRLAIVDLSPAGAQPMFSECGRFVFVFNGEIYNHKSLRARLDGEGRSPRWRGHSDSEVLLAAIAGWGLTGALQQANGMFGLALWDRQRRTLQLACDRFGEKPIYYGLHHGSFLFASELKSMRKFPGWNPQIDRNGLRLLMRYGYIPAPHSIIDGVCKVEPGTIATIEAANGPGQPGGVRFERYWSAHEMVARSRATQLRISETDALNEFDALFRSSVGMRMEADVPLGAFLSGGFDSTAVVAMMQLQSSRPVRTFSIGFSEPRFNEAPFAKAIARHLGTDHTELYVTPPEAMEVIPRLPTLYDEPFADSSQVPTFLVSKLARQHVTVALSGDGGDELFGGYNRYFLASKLLPGLTAAPYMLRRIAASTIRHVGARGWDGLYQALTLGRGKMPVGDRALKFAELLSAPTRLDGYHQLISSWQASDEIVLGGNLPTTVLDSRKEMPGGMSFVEQMMYLDLITYLPGDILTKVDRATMGVSLEGRIPFLDHRVAEFAWRLPLSNKIGGGEGKRIVKQLVHRYVPPKLMDRPKTGFGVPVGEWLRGPLRDWAEGLLDERKVAQGGYFNTKLVRECWSQHSSGRRNWEARLWPLLMFQAWLDERVHSA